MVSNGLEITNKQNHFCIDFVFDKVYNPYQVS